MPGIQLFHIIEDFISRELTATGVVILYRFVHAGYVFNAFNTPHICTNPEY